MKRWPRVKTEINRYLLLLCLVTLIFWRCTLPAECEGVAMSSRASTSVSENWDTLPHKRTLVVQFVSIERIKEFNRYWASHESYLMVPMVNTSLLLSCPYLDGPAVLETIIRPHNWTLVKQLNHAHSLTHGPLSLYRTTNGVEIFFQPIITTLPRYYMNNPTPPTCSKKTWSLSYTMYSGAVFSYHLIHLPMLRKFDIFLKIDTDIEFKGVFPIDVGRDMTDKGCVIGHTAIHASSDCERGSLKALAKATTALRLNASKSSNYRWCNKDGAGDRNSLIFYGNFLAFSTKLLLHTDVLKISHYFFDDWEDGYFASRWGDQAPFVMYVCHTLDVPDLYQDDQVCDYSEYRNTAFVHH